MNPFFNASINKFRNKKVIVDGITFDSKKESSIYLEIKLSKQKGAIVDFKRQVCYELIPAQFETITLQDNKGRTKEKQKCIERACTYTADFVVTYPDGEVVVIDAKGNKFLDKTWAIKRKLMLHVHKIRVREV